MTECSKGEAMGSRTAMQLWQDLPEVYRDSNRKQAASMPRTLQLDARRRYDIVQAHRKGGNRFTFPPDDLDLIARNEHARYVEERKRTEPGHPDLVPWDDLPEETQRDRPPANPRMAAIARQRRSDSQPENLLRSSAHKITLCRFATA